MQPNQPSIAQLEQAARGGNEMARLELGNRLLIEHPPGSDASERGLEMLRQAATGAQGPAAQWLLGGFYLQNLSFPDGLSRARHWMGLAADAGVGPALDRMANLHLRGLDGGFEPDRALELLLRLADAGFQRAAWEVGYLKSTLDELIDPGGAVSAFARACALSYPPAYYSLGLRFALGAGVPADPGFARALLLRAADAGFPDARAAADELAPAFEAIAAESWYDALKRNHAEAGGLLQQLGDGGMLIPAKRLPAIDQLETHFAGIGHPALGISADGRLQVDAGPVRAFRAEPADWHWLSERPRVATSAGFVSREERSHVMFMVAGALEAPEKYTSSSVNGAYENQYFSGTGKNFGALSSDAVVRCIERRIAERTDWRADALEPSSVICYGPGQEYRPHVDYFSHQQIADNRARTRDFGGQRVVTFLICLQDAHEGGETCYPRVDLKVEHRAGTAMLHYNTLSDGQPDEMSLHHGMPVTHGEKWLLRTTLRAHSRYVE